MRSVVRSWRKYAMVVVLAFAFASVSACEPNCGDSCESDSDCWGDLVCYSGLCAPSECRSLCSDSYINVCYFNMVTCDFIECD